MSLATKKTKAEKLGIDLKKIEEETGVALTEEKLDELIEEKQNFLDQEKESKRLQIAAEKKAEEEAKKNKIILKDVDGDDVDWSEYFWPRFEDEKLPSGKVLKAGECTVPDYFNRECGMPVDREDLLEVFNQFFPKKKGFLFYRQRDREVYIIIVPLKYATRISKANESRPGDCQRHAMSFITEGSVNLDSLKLKLGRIAKHSSISTEPLA
jgi:hypothetical protein